jgi:hypothetical protein
VFTFFKYVDNVIRFCEACASNLLIIIATLQLSKCYVLFTSIFVLSLFDNMSIYSFPTWHYMLLLHKRVYVSF